MAPPGGDVAAVVSRRPESLEEEGPWPGRTLRTAAIVAALAVTLVLIGAFGFTWAYSERIMPGIRADGVELDGMSPTTAFEALASRGQSLTASRTEVVADGVIWRPTLGELGVTLDARRLVRDAFSIGRPVNLHEALLFSLETPFRAPIDVGGPIVHRGRLNDWVDDVASKFDRPSVDARLEISPSGQVLVSTPSAGRRLDRALASDSIARTLDGWLVTRERTPAVPSLVLPVQSIAPTIDLTTLEPTRKTAEAILSRPWSLHADDESLTLSREQVASLLLIRQRDGDVTLDVDRARIGSIVAGLADKADRAPSDARLAITKDGKVEFIPDSSGLRVDRDRAVAVVGDALLAQNSKTKIAFPVTSLPAKVAAADLAPARDVAQRTLAGPITLAVGDSTIELAPSDVAAMLSVVNPADGAARIEVDPSALRGKLEALAPEVKRAPQVARLRVVGGEGELPEDAVSSLAAGGKGARFEELRPAVNGRRLDVDHALASLKTELTSGAREITVPTVAVPPAIQADGANFGNIELIEAATTSYYGSAPERAFNIELAAKLLDGVIVPPGATFSFNETTGPQTTGAGFKPGWGIIGGGENTPPKTVPSVGGGICQVATTLFHAVFWGGYQIDERNWHLYWIPKYGAGPKGLKGLDATVDGPYGVDLRWTNDTDTPVVIQALTDGGRITFGIYGKQPQRDVTASVRIDKYKPTKGETVRQPEKTMAAGTVLQVEEARDGFRSTIVRTVVAPGQEPRYSTFVSEYQPSRNVILYGTGGR